MAIIGGQHIEVAACALGHSGGSGAFVTEYNLDGTRRASSEIEFANNIFDSNFKFMYGPFSERGCGDGVRLRRAASNTQDQFMLRKALNGAAQLQRETIDVSTWPAAVYFLELAGEEGKVVRKLVVE